MLTIEAGLECRAVPVFNNANHVTRTAIRVFRYLFQRQPRNEKIRIAPRREIRLDLFHEPRACERAVQKIIAELEAGGVLERERHGRRNVYRILGKRPLRHPVESHCTVEGLIRFVIDSKP